MSEREKELMKCSDSGDDCFGCFFVCGRTTKVNEKEDDYYFMIFICRQQG